MMNNLPLILVTGLLAVLIAILINYFILVRSLKKTIQQLKVSTEVNTVEAAIAVEDLPMAGDSSLDVLTKLPNRKQLADYLQQIISSKQKVFNKYALFIVNLDFFRSVNNNLGYDIGDQIIAECADRLKQLFPLSSFIARMDGDEFALVLNTHTTDDIETACIKLLDTMKKPMVVCGQPIYISLSIGVAIFPDENSNVDDLIRNAATAVGIVKTTTRNNYKIYTSDIAEYSHQKFIIHSELRHALENNEFVLYYQPKIHGSTLKLVGIEALIRWNHPKRGLLYPLNFIPIAEETGIIKYIDEWVLYTACNQLKSWREQGIDNVRLAVNLSAWQFKDQHLVETVAKVLKDTGIEPASLELEITETTALENLSFAQSTLSKLIAMGINISIDDFGTGYSSLNYLKHFPINFLKIDRSFVADMLGDKNTYSIVRAIIEVAHALDLKVVAEGVENQEQLDQLKELGCDEIQGYLISKPLSVADISKHMQEKG